MLARIAHELYWLGRYLARAEHTSRMLEGVSELDLQGRPDDPAGITLSWGPVMAIMGVGWDGHRVDRHEALASLLLDSQRDTSVLACVLRAREGARTLRDVVPHDTWEAVNTLALELRGLARDVTSDDPTAVFREVRERCTLFWGLVGRTMLRDEAGAFLAAGERLEGADALLRTLRVALATGTASLAASANGSVGDGQAQALLQAVGGSQAFRRAMPGPPDAAHVVRFLLFEADYPNSVAAHVWAVRDALMHTDDSLRSSSPLLRLSRMTADLEFHRRSLDEAGRAELGDMCVTIQQELERVDRDIADRYFPGTLTVPGVTIA